MTQRERILAWCVGGTLIGLGAVWGVNKVLVNPIRTVREQITTERQRGNDLRKERKALAKADDQWQELAARTFAADPQQAQLRFMQRLHGLLELHDLIGDASTKDSKMSPGAITVDSNGFAKVPVTINTTGNFKQVVGFLCDFYREPYIARLDSVKLSADRTVLADAAEGESGNTRAATSGRGGRRTSGARRGREVLGPDGPELRVIITATTLVLPRLKGLDVQHLPDQWEPLETGQLRFDRVAYNDVFEKSLFKPYQPPRPKPEPVVVEQKPQPVVVEPKPDPVIPPPPVRPNAHNMFVRFTATLNGAPLTYVYDESNRGAPPEVLFHDDPIDDGTLLLINSRGLVVRVSDAGGTHADYFYPLGKSFADREPLSPEAHPKVWQAFLEEFGLEASAGQPPPGS